MSPRKVIASSLGCDISEVEKYQRENIYQIGDGKYYAVGLKHPGGERTWEPVADQFWASTYKTRMWVAQ